MTPHHRKQAGDWGKRIAGLGLVLTIGQQWVSIRGDLLRQRSGTEATAASVGAMQRDISRLSKAVAPVPGIAREVRRIKRRLRLPEGPPLPEVVQVEAPKAGLMQQVVAAPLKAVGAVGRWLFGG